MLPHESLLRSVAYHQKKDKDLGQTLMIRGPQTEWQYISFPLLRIKIMLPRFHKWQLTLLAYKRWVSGIGNYFMFSCLFNILFMLSFLFRVYWAALLSCFVLLYVLIKLYKRSGAFPTYIEQVSQDEIDKTRRVQSETQSLGCKGIKWRRISQAIAKK